MAQRIVYIGEKRTLPVWFGQMREIADDGDTLDSVTSVDVEPSSGLSVASGGVDAANDEALVIIDANGATAGSYKICIEVLTDPGQAEIRSDPIWVTVKEC